MGKTYTVDLYVTASAPGATVLLTLLGESSAVVLIEPSFNRAGDFGHRAKPGVRHRNGFHPFVVAFTGTAQQRTAGRQRRTGDR